MPVVKITRKAISSLDAGTYYDETLKGFGLRVGTSGRMTWFAEYRTGTKGRSSPKKRTTIGHADRLSPEAAREAAGKLLASVELGADPAAALAEERAAKPFSDVLSDFIEKHVRAKRKAATADYYEYVAKLHINPYLGKKSASSITRIDVDEMHGLVGKSGGKYVANRALAIVSAVYGWLDRNGPNPAKGVEKFKEQARERYLTDVEIAAIGDALHEAETTGLPHRQKVEPISKHARKPENRRTVFPVHVTNAFRLLMLTGMRLREVLNLEWKNVDSQRGLLFLPDSKTGRKTVVLSEPAIEVLKATPQVGRYVIASESAGLEEEKPRADLKRPWEAIQSRTGLDDVRIHDLRHTFGSVGAGAGLGLPVIGKLLGHSNPKTTQRYAHVAADASKRAADAIAGQIATALKGSKNA